MRFFRVLKGEHVVDYCCGEPSKIIYKGMYWEEISQEEHDALVCPFCGGISEWAALWGTCDCSHNY